MTRKPVEESIGRRDDQAIVRPGAVLAIRFAHKFAGVIGFQILHHGNSAGSFDVLLVFSHGGDLRFCMKKAPYFVQHIIDNDPGFDMFSFEGFRPTLEIIKSIVEDADRN